MDVIGKLNKLSDSEKKEVKKFGCNVFLPNVKDDAEIIWSILRQINITSTHAEKLKTL